VSGSPSHARILYSAFDVVPSPKGAGTHIAHFVAGLTRAGHEVVLVTPRAPGLPDEDTFQGALHLRVGRPAAAVTREDFLVRALSFGEATLHAAESHGPFDVAHFRALWSGLPLLLRRDSLAAPRRPRLLTLFEANSLAAVELPFHYPGLLGHPLLDKLGRLERLILAEVDAIVCVSRVTRAYLTGLGARGERIAVIPNGVDPEAFVATPLPPRAGRVPEALYVGTLADWQGLLPLVEAWPRVLARHPARLRLVGRGRARQRKELQRRIRKLELEAHVTLEPAVPHEQVPALLASADLSLAPLGYNERNVVQGCCPLKLLESMAAGRPIVASNLPVVRELVREGREALLVPPDAPDALAAAVLRLLDEPKLAARLGASGARRAREQFTWERAQSRLLDVYAGLLCDR
jgi:glycosyltransferase involved in cell wall biosynthesis